MLPISLAPLHGYTDAIFRNAFKNHFKGVTSYYAPFITTVNARTVAKSHLRDILQVGDQAGVVIPQILGKDRGPVLLLAQTMHALGYHEVNWNLGCPFVKVTRKKRGSGLLPHPDDICRVLDHLFPRITAGFSLKLRLGLHDHQELLTLLPRLDQYPLGSLIIHPRTADQGYSGNADVDRFEETLSYTRHPVLYNGDITTIEGIRIIEHRFRERICGIMIGRGLIGNPFLAEGRVNPIIPGKGPRFWRFHDEVVSRYLELPSGKSFILGKIKSLWMYWKHSLLLHDNGFNNLRKVKTFPEYLDLVGIINKTCTFGDG